VAKVRGEAERYVSIRQSQADQDTIGVGEDGDMGVKERVSFDRGFSGSTCIKNAGVGGVILNAMLGVWGFV